MNTVPDLLHGLRVETSELRTQLVAVAAKLTELGLSPGTSGNISVRCGKLVLTSPGGESLGKLDPERLSVLDLAGNLLSGPPSTKEFPLHRAFYRRDPRTQAVVHLHSAHAAAASCLPPWSARSAVGPVSPYFVMRVGQTPLISYADPGDLEQAASMEQLSIPFRAALLQNHGSLVAGPSLGAAADTAVELEEACQLWLQLHGKSPHLLSPADCKRLAKRYGSIWD